MQRDDRVRALRILQVRHPVLVFGIKGRFLLMAIGSIA